MGDFVLPSLACPIRVQSEKFTACLSIIGNMITNEFEAFQIELQNHIAEKFTGRVGIHSCRVSGSHDLLGLENEIVKKAVPKRRNEFAAGRVCARKCLTIFGIENFEILQGKFGEPLWPEGITGSITHHSGIALAASMPLEQGYIGIDIVDLTEKLTDPSAVLNEKELSSCGGKNFENIDLLLFSMKEAVVKILSPLLQEYLEFKDIEIEFDSKAVKVSYRAHQLDIDLSWLGHDRCALTLATMKNLPSNAYFSR